MSEKQNNYHNQSNLEEFIYDWTQNDGPLMWLSDKAFASHAGVWESIPGLDIHSS